MGLAEVTMAVLRTGWNRPPARLGRFLVIPAVPGACARDVLRRHQEAQRRYDENTLQVLASVALWQRHGDSPTCLPEAEAVLGAFCRQSEANLDTALDPHAAAVVRLLLSPDAARAESSPGPTAGADPDLGGRWRTHSRAADPSGRVRAHA